MRRFAGLGRIVLNVRSVADLNRAIVANLHRLDRQSFDAVVGIPRSGMIPASLIATHLQKPLADVESYCLGFTFERFHTIVRAPRVLLVDDSVNKGRAMGWAAEKLRAKGAQVTRLAVYGPYQLEDPAKVVDIWFEDCRGPRVFQWNMWKHIRLDRWAFDFDGVFCRDPSREENDDGARYLRFLETAEPLFIPTRPIGHIVTGRLEKYRKPTIAWLERHGIKPASLTMMPFSTKAERMAAGGRGQWKAGIVKSLGVELFIESDPKQAGIITKVAGIPVWCVETQSLAGGVG